MPKKITITAAARELTPVSLVGKDYMVRPMKGAVGLQVAKSFQGAEKEPEEVAELMSELVSSLFPKADATKVNKRLLDPNDDLDYPHIMELFQQLSAVETENPTM